MNKGMDGVVGLGDMGSGIACNFRKAGAPLMVWGHLVRRTRGIRRLTRRRGRSAGRHGSCLDAIIFVVTATPEIESCFEGSDGTEGLLTQARKGLVVYDFTTSDPVHTRALAARAADRGIACLDAVMSGGATGADAGTLTLMVGGDKAAFDELMAEVRAARDC